MMGGHVHVTSNNMELHDKYYICKYMYNISAGSSASVRPVNK